MPTLITKPEILLQHQPLLDRIGDIELFSALSDDSTRALIEQLELIEISAGEVLVRQHDESKDFYVLLDGSLSVVLESQNKNMEIAKLSPGSVVGEIALLAGGKRSATVLAETDSIAALLTSAGLHHLLEKNPKIGVDLALMVTRRLRKSQLSSHLLNMFEGLDGEALKLLEDIVQWHKLSLGDVLYTQHDAGESAYLLVSGRLRGISYSPAGEIENKRTILPGDIVGELSMLLGQARTETIVSGRDSEVVCIERAAFNELNDIYPKLTMELARAVLRGAQGVKPGSKRLHEKHLSIALVFLDPNIKTEDLTQPLASKLAEIGDTITLEPSLIDKMMGKSGMIEHDSNAPGRIQLLHWLSEMEESHRFIIYQANHEQSLWADRAIQQADQVIYIADADGDHRTLEAELDSRDYKTIDCQSASLILLHHADTRRPEKTSRWLKNRLIESVYHVRRGNDGDISRLSRILSGRAISLVLGGGGARGFAHLGVLRALEEVGLTVDMIGGTSIGAPIAQLIAQGRSATESKEIIRKNFASLLDYTLPLTSLLTGRRISKTIDHYALQWDIEDLWLPYFCVSTNLTKAKAVIHKRGNLAQAVRASISIPGILPPVPFNGDLLVDGGVVNNLPIDVMREMNPTGAIIAVDLTPEKGQQATVDYGHFVSGWRLLLNRLNPFENNINSPSLGSTIVDALTIGSASARETMLNCNMADLYLNIHPSDYGLLQFDAVDEIEKIGFDQSIDLICAWEKTLNQPSE